MNILKKEILPLFEITRRGKSVEANQLIKTDLNEYALYVDLEDIYLQKDQFHQILINHQKLEYTIPLHYHQIILQGKGYHYQDLVIQIYSIKHPKFFRVNSNDLLTCCRVSPKQFKTGLAIIKHLDEEEIEIDLTQGHIIKINDKGLPTADRSRGALYVLVEIIPEKDSDKVLDGSENESNDDKSVNESNDDSQTLSDLQYNLFAEILNYHQNSNVLVEE